MDKTPPKTDIELLSEISGLLPTTIEANYQWVLEAMTAAREEGRREGAGEISALKQRINELKKEIEVLQKIKV